MAETKARSDFVKYINRSKSTFTDMLKRPPASLPKGAGKESWIRIRDFLKDEASRRSFLDDFGAKRRKRLAAIPKDRATDPETNEPPAKQQPAKFEKWQQASVMENHKAKRWIS